MKRRVSRSRRSSGRMSKRRRKRRRTSRGIVCASMRKGIERKGKEMEWHGRREGGSRRK